MDGVEIGVAAFSIRLNVVAFGPLVPCLQENDAPLIRVTGHPLDRFLQICLEEFRRIPFKNDTLIPAARRIVPTWQHAGQVAFAGRQIPERMSDDDLQFIALRLWFRLLWQHAMRGRMPSESRLEDLIPKTVPVIMRWLVRHRKDQGVYANSNEQ